MKFRMNAGMNLVENPPGTRWERGVGEEHARKELGVKRRERAANVECSRRATAIVWGRKQSAREVPTMKHTMRSTYAITAYPR